jgi:hypothetical protein
VEVGILSAAYKSPKAAEVALTAGLNKSGDRTVKVQGLTGQYNLFALNDLIS